MHRQSSFIIMDLKGIMKMRILKFIYHGVSNLKMFRLATGNLERFVLGSQNMTNIFHWSLMRHKSH